MTLEAFNLSLQDFIIVVGPTLTAVTNVFVSIDSILYSVPSVLQALDICFKAFHTSSAKYPPESEHIWLIIQRFIYKIKTIWDKKIPVVEKILQDLNKLI